MDRHNCADEEELLPMQLPQTLPPSLPVALDPAILNEESTRLLQELIATTDLDRTKDLTYLFNINQNKKTTVRISKLNELLDMITNQAMRRLSSRPDEISNKQLLDSLRIVQANLESSQKQVAYELQPPAPFIQINNQKNEVSIGGSDTALDRSSRERVKNAVLSILQSITSQAPATQPIVVQEVQQDEDQD